MQKYSHFKIIPDSFKKTSQYEANKHVDGTFEIFDNFSSTEFLSYIETDLENEGLLPSKSETKTKEKPEQKSDGSKKVPWSDDASDYMKASEAIVNFTDSKMLLSKLSKILKPDGPIRYMRKKQRCKIHIGDFHAYA